MLAFEVKGENSENRFATLAFDAQRSGWLLEGMVKSLPNYHDREMLE